MNQKNQILLIEKFLASNEQSIIINQVNDELGIFYFHVIKYFADKISIKIKINDNNQTTETTDDLFGQQEIKLYYITNTKKLTSILEEDNKKIIFTDYKNYKKLNSRQSCVNGYNFLSDVVFFIKDVLRIDNEELIYYCKNNPTLLISETSKYLINDNRYVKDQTLVEEKNHILNIRKSIFDIKRNNPNIKNLYLNIKAEAEYKKLNFLIY
jgi:hypothetical protein